MWIIKDGIMIDWDDVRTIRCSKSDSKYEKIVEFYYKNNSSSHFKIGFKKITGVDFIKYMGVILRTPEKLPIVLEIDDELEDLIIGKFKTIEEFNNK